MEPPAPKSKSSSSSFSESSTKTDAAAAAAAAEFPVPSSAPSSTAAAPTTSNKPPPASNAYVPPEWGGRPSPGEPCITLDIIRNGIEMGQLDLSQGDQHYYTFGRMQGGGVTFVLDNPTVSRLHAVIQFRASDGSFHLKDLRSTHGSMVNKQKCPAHEWIELHVGDMLQFGQSSRYYLVNGPEDLRPPEVETEELRTLRERSAASQARREQRRKAKEEEEPKVDTGISWGMDEEAVEDEDQDQEGHGAAGKWGQDGEDEDGKTGKAELPDYLKNLPESQKRAFEKGRGEGGVMGELSIGEDDVHERDRKMFEKLRAKAIKIENMETEISRIYAKESSQSGLTDGQRAAVARNEQRITQLKDEIEQIEEQIRNKNAQRGATGKDGGDGKSKGKGKKGSDGENDEDNDEFYNRAKGAPGGNWRMRRRGRGAGGRDKDKAKASTGGGPAETYESLTAILENTRMQLVALEAANLEGSNTAADDDKGAAADKGDDSLESFMAANEAKKKEQAKLAWESRKEELGQKVTRLEALIKIVKPALPSLKTRGAPDFAPSGSTTVSETIPSSLLSSVKKEGEEEGKEETPISPLAEKPTSNSSPIKGPAVAMPPPLPSIAKQSPLSMAPPPPLASKPSPSSSMASPSIPLPVPASQQKEGMSSPTTSIPTSAATSKEGDDMDVDTTSSAGSSNGDVEQQQKETAPSSSSSASSTSKAKGTAMMRLPPPSTSSSSSSTKRPASALSAAPSAGSDREAKGNGGPVSKASPDHSISSTIKRLKAGPSRDLGEEEVEKGGRQGKKAAGGSSASSSIASNAKKEEEIGPAFVGYFQRPRGQKGDGRTALNEKLGY